MHATSSELFPLRSGIVDIWRSQALVPLAATGLTGSILFELGLGSKDRIELYMWVLATYLMFIIVAALHAYSGERKPLLWYLWPAIVVYAEIVYLWPFYDRATLAVLPIDAYPPPREFWRAFPVIFVVIGLREELAKALPVLLSLVIMLAARPQRGVPRALALVGPLDGVLMGAASGAAFTLDEALHIYVPRAISSVIGHDGGEQGLAYAYGIGLLVPRLLSTVIGHTALAAIFGYYVGLCVRFPGDTVRLLLIGLLASATLHTLYDTLHYALGEAGYWIASAVIFLAFMARLLQAKQVAAFECDARPSTR